MLCPICKSSNHTWHNKPTRKYCKDCGKYFQVNNAYYPEGTQKPNIDVDKNIPEEIVEPLKIEHKKDSIEITSQKIDSLEKLLEHFKTDMEAWVVDRHIINTWETVAFSTDSYEDEDGNIHKQKIPVPYINHQVKAVLKPISDIPDWEWFKKDFIAAAKKQVKARKVTPRKKPKSDFLRNMVEVNLYDLHLMKLGWDPETGDGNYDHHIAIERAYEAVDGLIHKFSVYDIEEIHVPWGHDFFNSDIETTGAASTAAGTPQHNDGRWQKMWVLGRKLSIGIIEKLKTIAPVKVIVTPGNHDFQKIFYLGDLIEVYADKDPHITVLNQAIPRKYIRYGNTLIGHTHKVGGKDAPSEQRLLQLMPAERESRFEFADTEFHEWHVGHLHHHRKQSQMDSMDHQGIVIRYMRSLSAADAWHANSGYIGAVKGSEAHVYNYVTGPEAYFNHNLVFDPEADRN